MIEAVLVVGLVAVVLAYALVSTARAQQETTRQLVTAVVALKDKDAAVVVNESRPAPQAQVTSNPPLPAGIGPDDWGPAHNDIEHTTRNGA